MSLTAKLLAVSLAAGVLAPQSAWAEQQGGPAPGTKDATQVSSSNRQANSDYNHLIGAGDPKSAEAPDKPKAPSKAVAATAADIKAGAALRDSRGVRIGTIDSVTAQTVVVNTGQTKIGVPLVAFGKDNNGLLLGITAARFGELVAKAKGSN